MAKEYEPEDPNELIGVTIPGGDPRQALDGIVQEYLLMGWTEREIMMLFQSPYYGATHQIYREQGPIHVNGRVRDLAGRWNEGWLSNQEPSQPKGDEKDA